MRIRGVALGTYRKRCTIGRVAREGQGYLMVRQEDDEMTECHFSTSALFDQIVAAKSLLYPLFTLTDSEMDSKEFL